MARKLTFDEAARMTKIRPQIGWRKLRPGCTIFRNSPASCTRKGFLLIYGEFWMSTSRLTGHWGVLRIRERDGGDGRSYFQEKSARNGSRRRGRRPAATVSRPGGASGFAQCHSLWAWHGFSARLSWHEIFSQCAEARGCARKLDRANVAQLRRRRLPLGRGSKRESSFPIMRCRESARLCCLF